MNVEIITFCKQYCEDHSIKCAQLFHYLNIQLHQLSYIYVDAMVLPSELNSLRKNSPVREMCEKISKFKKEITTENNSMIDFAPLHAVDILFQFQMENSYDLRQLKIDSLMMNSDENTKITDFHIIYVVTNSNTYHDIIPEQLSNMKIPFPNYSLQIEFFPITFI
jgi:hypothetical protein